MYNIETDKGFKQRIFCLLIFTVPTTCSRPSIEMIGFMYVCMYVFINVFLRVHSPGHTVIYF